MNRGLSFVFLNILLVTTCSGAGAVPESRFKGRSITEFVSGRVANKTPKGCGQRRYIFTGAPATGKTTTINELRKKGFVGFDEPATRVIAQRKSEGCSEPWLELKFDEYILARIGDDHKEVAEHGEKILFHDRTAIDALRYAINRLAITEMLADEALLAAVSHAISFYEPVVFYFEPIGRSLEENNVRYEKTDDEVEQLALAFIADYEALGFVVIRVPFMPVEERVDFICGVIAGYARDESDVSV